MNSTRTDDFSILFYSLAAAVLILCWIAGGIPVIGHDTAAVFIYAALWFTGLLLIIAFPRISEKLAIRSLMVLAVASRTAFVAARIYGGHLTAGELITAGLDLATAAFIIGILSRRRLSVRWVLLYLFYPVILNALYGRELMGMAALCAFSCGMYLFHRRWWRSMYLSAGMAAAIFPAALAGAVFFINRSNIRKIGFLAVGAVLVISIRCIGFGTALWPRHAAGQMPGAVAAVLHHLVALPVGSSVCLAATAAAICIGIGCFHPQYHPRFQNDPMPGIFFVFCAVAALMPTVSGVSLIWVAPVLAIRPSLAWVLIGLTIGSILSSLPPTVPAAGLSGWTGAIFWLPLYLLFPYQAYRFLQHRRNMSWTARCRSLSVVIPARNEAENIVRCVESVRSDPAVCEVIVIDGGSADQTSQFAKRAGAHVIVHDRPIEDGGGRGGQIRAGLMAATGDAVAIVHADAVADTLIFSKIAGMLDQNPEVAGGAVGCRFDSLKHRLRAIEFANDLRMACFGISFGDQVQFCRRQPVAAADLFPAIPLMEDVEFSMRLHGMGRQVFLFGDVRVSARRWRKKSCRNSLWVIRQVAAYLVRRTWSVPDTVSLYRMYYPDGDP